MQHGPMKATPRPIITTPDICRCFEMGEPLAERFPGDCSLFAHAETEASRAEVTLPHGRGLANSKAKALAMLLLRWPVTAFTDCKTTSTGPSQTTRVNLQSTNTKDFTLCKESRWQWA